MPAGFLTVITKERTYPPVPIEREAIIGRMLGCDCVIDDPAASRKHVSITAEGGMFRWRDLGSTNGTIVNGRPMTEGILKHGDILSIGEVQVRFETEPLKPAVDEDPGTTLFKQTILDGGVAAQRPEHAVRMEELFRAAYTVMNAIGASYDACELVDTILRTTMAAVHGERGAIFFAGAEEPELKPCPQCGHVHMIEDGQLRHVHESDIRISRTVANRVLRDGESVLYRDADKGDLNPSESIMALNLRSIICAPLRDKSGILGLLYVDSDKHGDPFSQEELLLSTAVANSAGLALENATMHQQILDKQRTDQEIQHAWIIQQGFLVKNFPEDDPRFSVYGEMIPAKSVGGDFYDFVRPDEHHVGILIGDVSGKGVPAALTMAQLLAEFRIHSRMSSSPAEVLSELNKDLGTSNQRGMFCTLCYVLVDLRTGRGLCANLGHHPLLCVSMSGATTLWGGASGPPAGVLDECAVIDESVSIAPGDTLLLYTDGIVEARLGGGTEIGPSLKEFGIEGLRAVLAEERCLPPDCMLERIKRAVQAYCAPGVPHDDCTMIALRYENGV